MIYLYITPSGSVNLQDADKMPPQYHSTQWYKKYSESHEHANPNQSYEADLKAAKASSIPCNDQERAVSIIAYGQTILDIEKAKAHYCKPDTFYGPFDIEYRRLRTTVVRDYLPGEEIERREVAILLPEKDTDTKFAEVCKKHIQNAPTKTYRVIPEKEPTPSKSGELKLTPEQIKEREEAINWYRGDRTIENKKEWSALEIAIYACNAGNSEERINEVASMIERFTITRKHPF